jgi:ketosteroid isomerase-like protein
MSDNVETVRGMYEAFERGDVPAVLGLFDPKIEWNEAEHFTFWNGAPFVGPDAVVESVFMAIGETFGDTFRVNVDRLHGAGDTVVMEGRYTGVVQSTGKSVDAQVAHVIDLKDGKIVRFQQYTDTWQFAEATGKQPDG